jgi:hypothetical protein
LAVSFTDLSNVPSPSAWHWDFGDGSTSTEQHPTHNYLLPGSYNVRLSVTGSAGAREIQKNNLITVNNPVGIPDHTPGAFALHASYPNPFREAAVVAYDLAGSARVRLNVYDVRGGHVRTLVDDLQPPGVYTIEWNGRSDTGRAVASGIYFTRFTALTPDSKEFVQTRKMVIMR